MLKRLLRAGLPNCIAAPFIFVNKYSQQLGQLLADHPDVFAEIRGQGLLLGLKLKVPNTEFVAAARREQHLLVVGAGDNVIRILPPLTIDETHVREAVEKLSATAKTFESKAKTDAA